MPDLLFVFICFYTLITVFLIDFGYRLFCGKWPADPTDIITLSIGVIITFITVVIIKKHRPQVHRGLKKFKKSTAKLSLKGKILSNLLEIIGLLYTWAIISLLHFVYLKFFNAVPSRPLDLLLFAIGTIIAYTIVTIKKFRVRSVKLKSEV